MSAILEIIREYTGETISPEAAFEDLKIDSLEFIEIIREVESIYQVSIPDEDLGSIHTVRDLIHRAGDVRHSD